MVFTTGRVAWKL